jgi:hypothetical protein
MGVVVGTRLTGRMVHVTGWAGNGESVFKNEKAPMAPTPTPGGVHGGKGKMLTSFSNRNVFCFFS